MPNRNTNISTPVKGLNLDSAQSLLDTKEAYTYALNARQESEDGNTFYLSNEGSNVLAINFPEGYRVIGRRTIEDDMTILFLYNPITKDSEIGSIKHDIKNCIDNINDIEDIDLGCDSCGKNYKYPENTGENLKLSTNTCQVYTPILNNKCLNFSLNHPVHKIDYKITNQTIIIYWTDDFGKMKWLDLNKIPLLDDGTLDCNKLNVFPDFSIPCISIVEELETGSLKAGTYQFFVAYSNSKGEELSEYYSVTNPASIWENKLSNELSFTTKKSIRINVSNLDTRYKYFNLAVGETINNVTEFKLVGYFDITNDVYNYVYTGNDKTIRSLTTSEIFFKTPTYVRATTVAAQNNILMFGGLESEESVNYQSVASNIILGWEDYIIPHNEFESYNTAQNTANYRSYLRDEVYALEFVPILKSGKLGPRTHIPGPKSQTSYWEIISNKDSESFKRNPCDNIEEVYKWQIYNTAKLTGYTKEFNDSLEGDCYVGTYRYGTLGFYQSTELYPNTPDTLGDLAGTPIRHHKMPGVDISPIFSSKNVGSEIKYKIHPLGIKVDHRNIIEAIEKSNLTQEQKDNIIGFQITRATRTGNNSILAKGILYNVGQYTRDNETFYYNNYPYNDLGRDPFISTSEPEAYTGPNDGSPMLRKSKLEICWNQNNSYKRESDYIEIDYKNDEDYSAIHSVASTFTINNIVTNFLFAFEVVHIKKTDNQEEQFVIKLLEDVFSADQLHPGIFSTDGGSYKYMLAKFCFELKRKTLERNVLIVLGFAFEIDPIENKLIFSELELDTEKEDSEGYVMIDGVVNSTNYVLNPARKFHPSNEGAQKLNHKRFNYCVIDEVEGEIGGEDIRLEGFIKGVSDKRFQFISPNTTFNRPSVGGYLKIENILSGKAEAYLTQVKDEPKYNINTSLTVKVAVSLAASTIIIMTQNGGSFGSPTMEVNLGNFAPTFIQSLDMMNKLVPFRRYGYQYLSVGNYSDSLLNTQEGNMVRTLDISGYVDSGMQGINDEYILNNFNRESSVYLRTNESLPYPHEYGAPIDNSRFNFNSYKKETGITLKDRERVFRNISSLYGSIKRTFNDQYGLMYSYRSVSTGTCFYLDRENLNKDLPTVFGGDTFINKFAIKRKIPFFLTNTVGFPNGSDVAYDELGNIGYPTYWLSTFPIESKLSKRTLKQADKIFKRATKITLGNVLAGIFTGGGANIAPFVKFAMYLGVDVLEKIGIKNTNFDRYSEDGISQIGTFYLFAYGIPNFFVESDINVDLRQAENSTDKNFYPNVGTDIPEDWLQEANVSMTKDNFYFYNRDFSKQNIENFYPTLERDFDPNKINKDYYQNRVIYSETSNLEERQDNWLVYKANNYYDFPLTNGKLIDLNPLEQGKVLARFEDNISVYNAFVQIDTDNKTAIVGTGSMFANPPQEFSNAQQGYLGTQHKAFESTKYGYFWLDAKRGEVFKLGTNNSGLEEISKKGMSNWFKENLPFRLLRYYPDINIDNSFNSVGISTVWDNRYERYFITKIDYVPLKPNILYDGNEFYTEEIVNKTIFDRDGIVRTVISLKDPEYFANCSWTIAYSPKTESWVSWYSFIPNYYIGQIDYFQSGINGTTSSLWNHNLTNKSYQVFYNNLYPFEVESIVGMSVPSKTLQSVQYRLDVLRYNSLYDYKLMQNISFDQAEVYNNMQTSGTLNLVLNNRRNIFNDTKIVNSDSISISLSTADDIHKFNQFYDITKDANSNRSLHEYDPSNVYKEINPQAVDYNIVNDLYSAKRLKSDVFKIKLSNTKQSRYKYIFKWILFKIINSVR